MDFSFSRMYHETVSADAFDQNMIAHWSKIRLIIINSLIYGKWSAKTGIRYLQGNALPEIEA